MLTKRNAIKANHPIRRAIAELSSGRCYDTKGAFMGSLHDTLGWFGVRLVDFADCPNDEGHATWLLYHGDVELETMIVCTWYRHGTGRYEFIVYLT